MKAMTASMQRYINAVYELSSDYEGARVSDIAVKLGVTKASACIAMKNLEQKGLVCRDSLRQVFLTEDGRYQAVSALDKYAIIYRFLKETLKINQEVAEADAHAMECIISLNTVCAICHFLRTEGTKLKCPKARVHI